MRFAFNSRQIYNPSQMLIMTIVSQLNYMNYLTNYYPYKINRIAERFYGKL